MARLFLSVPLRLVSSKSHAHPTKRWRVWTHVLALLLLGLLACNTTNQFELSLDEACSVPPNIQQHLKGNTHLRGCLVMFWQSQPPTQTYAHPIQIDNKGNISLVSRDNKAETNQLKIPVSGSKHPLLFRIYLFTPPHNNAVSNDFQEHELSCNTMGASKYNCFENLKECWGAFLFEPKLKSGNSSLQVFPLQRQDGQKCLSCMAEICDGIDNDCNGLVDEFDAINKVPCPKKNP